MNFSHDSPGEIKDDFRGLKEDPAKKQHQESFKIIWWELPVATVVENIFVCLEGWNFKEFDKSTKVENV